MKDRILVTGGAGFIGKSLINKLLYLGYHINVIDIVPNTFWNNEPKIKYFQGSIDNLMLLDEALFEVDLVYHLMATTNKLMRIYAYFNYWW